MIGPVDASGRALVRIVLRHPATAASFEMDAWVDTAFTGELLLARTTIRSLGLPRASVVRAGLGDGSEVVLDTYLCLIEWFGESSD